MFKSVSVSSLFRWKPRIYEYSLHSDAYAYTLFPMKLSGTKYDHVAGVTPK